MSGSGFGEWLVRGRFRDVGVRLAIISGDSDVRLDGPRRGSSWRRRGHWFERSWSGFAFGSFGTFLRVA